MKNNKKMSIKQHILLALKEVFEAYANIWASKSTEEYTKLLLIMDTLSRQSKS